MAETKRTVAWRRWGGIAAAIGGAAIAGAGLLWARERFVETPDHEVLEADGAFELRRYRPMLVAETVQTGTRDRALGNGFRLLADYIFAQSRGGGDAGAGEKIAMTAPVLAERDGAAGAWRVAFVMPKRFTAATLPPPGPGVRVRERPGRRVAALRFAGGADDRRIAAAEAALLAQMAARGLAAAGPVQHAFYNSPLVPAPVRRNEVWVEID